MAQWFVIRSLFSLYLGHILNCKSSETRGESYMQKETVLNGRNKPKKSSTDPQTHIRHYGESNPVWNGESQARESTTTSLVGLSFTNKKCSSLWNPLLIAQQKKISKSFKWIILRYVCRRNIINYSKWYYILSLTNLKPFRV